MRMLKHLVSKLRLVCQSRGTDGADVRAFEKKELIDFVHEIL